VKQARRRRRKFVATAVAEKVSALETAKFFADRKARRISRLSIRSCGDGVEARLGKAMRCRDRAGLRSRRQVGMASALQNLVDQKQVRQQRSQMDRCIQVIDQLRAQRRLRQDQLHNGERVAGVAI
jgi:hypothetical protein